MTESLPQIPPAALADLNRRMATLADGSTVFNDDSGTPIFDIDREGVPYADARAAAAWLHRAHPGLWGSETPAKATDAPAPAPQTATQIMQAVRDGRMSAAAATAAIARLSGSSTTAGHVPTTASAAPSVTDLMVRARRGDDRALTELINRYIK